MHSLGNLFCYCYQCQGCPPLKNFLKEEKKYCSICVFQDSFNLLELNESKRDRVKLNNYYSEILKVCCEAKRTCAFEENFYERNIHFVVKNDGVYTSVNGIEDFSILFVGDGLEFQNILIGVLFVVLVEVYFGLDKNKFQICVISFYLGYYFGKKRLPQLYVEINDFIFN